MFKKPIYFWSKINVFCRQLLPAASRAYCSDGDPSSTAADGRLGNGHDALLGSAGSVGELRRKVQLLKERGAEIG